MSTYTRELVQLDQDLAALARAEELLVRAVALRQEDPRTAYELTHRAALRTAGVVVARANRTRRRRLPLNVWTALDRIGGPGRAWAEASTRFVVERDRLDRHPGALPDPELLAEHQAATRERIDTVRAALFEPAVPVRKAG